MLKHVETDPSFPPKQRFADPSAEPVVLINRFDVGPGDHGAFEEAWRQDSEFFEFFKRRPGYISAQLRRGTLGSRVLLDHAAFGATNDQPEFMPPRGVYPDGATAHPHLSLRVAAPGLCVNNYRR